MCYYFFLLLVLGSESDTVENKSVRIHNTTQLLYILTKFYVHVNMH
jgi:hypothetical protein